MGVTSVRFFANNSYHARSNSSSPPRAHASATSFRFLLGRPTVVFIVGSMPTFACRHSRSFSLLHRSGGSGRFAAGAGNHFLQSRRHHGGCHA
jgi:hypothetical protein